MWHPCVEHWDDYERSAITTISPKHSSPQIIVILTTREEVEVHRSTSQARDEAVQPVGIQYISYNMQAVKEDVITVTSLWAR